MRNEKGKFKMKRKKEKFTPDEAPPCPVCNAEPGADHAHDCRVYLYIPPTAKVKLEGHTRPK
jgi:hypothetical protein